MTSPFLLPGQEYCHIRTEEHGSTKVDYAYCSESGRYFSCTAGSEKEAREQCEHFLLRHDRH